MDFKKGDVFYTRVGPGKPYKAHVVAIVDGNMVVYKYYGRHKQWWHYEVEHKESLIYMLKFRKELDAKKA